MLHQNQDEQYESASSRQSYNSRPQVGTKNQNSNTNTKIRTKIKKMKSTNRISGVAKGSAKILNSKKVNLVGEVRTSKQLLILVLFLIGLIICVSSIVALIMLPHFVSQQIAKKLVLKNNSMLLERWSKPNVPMYFKVWLFNVVNAKEILAGRETKPRVEELGPFVFNLKRQKDVVSFAGENLYYTERRIYHFNRELSCCAINTTVTIPNIPLVAVVDRALGYNLPLVGRFIPRLINRAIQSLREQLFVRKQVREILFDGYEVELLRMVSRIGSLIGLPQQSQNFALLKGRNDTWRPEQDGVWAINTGQRDRKQFGRVSSWNSYKRLPFWPAPACNVINGSDGTLFPPPIQRTQPLYIFNQELCRTVNLVYDGPSTIRSIQSYRFVLNPLNFAHTMSPATVATVSPATPPVRINPTFQNPAATGAGQPVTAHAAHATSAPTKPTTNLLTPPTSRDLKPSASNVVPAAVATPSSPRPSIPNSANLQEPTTTTTNSHKDATSGRKLEDEKLISEQERLIRIAQEAQLANERRLESRINPQTCFCDRKTTNLNGVNVCEFDGLIDLSRCSKQAQVIFGSMPHFHQSDARLLRQVNGLQPNASKHTTYLDIEPNTGLVLGGKRRVQLNLIIKHNNEIDGFENINDMLVPVVWFEESAMIPEESAQKFRSLYIERVRLVNWSLISLLIASIILLIVDARLLVTTHYWRQFKLVNLTSTSTTNAPVGRQSQQPEVNKSRNNKLALSGLAKKLTTTSSGHQLAVDEAEVMTIKNGGNNITTNSGKHLTATCPLVPRPRGANLPLLSHASSSTSYATSTRGSTSTTTMGASQSSTSSSCSSTPAGSPELRKWAGPTRVHLNGGELSMARDGQPETLRHDSSGGVGGATG